MVGKEYEEGGIARDGAKLVMAVACADVPKFTVVTGGLVRCRQLRDVRSRLRAAAAVDVAERRISVMGGEQAATVLTMVGDADPDEIRATYEAEGNPYFSTGAALGRRHHRSRSTRGGARARARLPLRTRRCQRRPSASSACKERYVAYSIVHVDDIEGAGPGGAVHFVRRELGVEAFGINWFEIPPNTEGREHDESETGQEGGERHRPWFRRLPRRGRRHPGSRRIVPPLRSGATRVPVAGRRA
jgi:hypothetical protein